MPIHLILADAGFWQQLIAAVVGGLVAAGASLLVVLKSEAFQRYARAERFSDRLWDCRVTCYAEVLRRACAAADLPDTMVCAGLSDEQRRDFDEWFLGPLTFLGEFRLWCSEAIQTAFVEFHSELVPILQELAMDGRGWGSEPKKALISKLEALINAARDDLGVNPIEAKFLHLMRSTEVARPSRGEPLDAVD